MPIIVDGTTIQSCEGVEVDNTNMYAVNADSQRVYTESCEYEGCVVFDDEGTFYWWIPEDVSQIELCMVGGGGSGGNAEDNSGANPLSGGGGYAGQEYHNTISVPSGTTATIVVGSGGLGRDVQGVGGVNGNPGGHSGFNGTTVSGGAGGTGAFSTSPSNYKGNGAAGPSGCGGGGYNDGVQSTYYGYANGGQASSFGNGGKGFYCGANNCRGETGGVGAGGGGVVTMPEGMVAYSGHGGRGEVRIGTDCLKGQVRVSELSTTELAKLGIKKIK